jgi:4-aminobutyrate aminotransferase-like enzyme
MNERGVIHDLDLLTTARRVLPGGALGTFLPPPDLEFVVARGQGSRVYDADGRGYLDYVLASYINLAAKGYMSLAHNDADLAETLGIFDESLEALG